MVTIGDSGYSVVSTLTAATSPCTTHRAAELRAAAGNPSCSPVVDNTPLLTALSSQVSALYNPVAQRMYPFSHFNAIQTQIFHSAYHTDDNLLVGAPTGSGKVFVRMLVI